MGPLRTACGIWCPSNHSGMLTRNLGQMMWCIGRRQAATLYVQQAHLTVGHLWQWRLRGVQHLSLFCCRCWQPLIQPSAQVDTL